MFVGLGDLQGKFLVCTLLSFNFFIGNFRIYCTAMIGFNQLTTQISMRCGNTNYGM